MYTVMAWVRGVVYRLGFNPKEGSIFYSPTLWMAYFGVPAFVKGFQESYDQTIRELREKDAMVIAKTIHIIESEDNPVTICTGEPYDRPKILEGVLVSFCSVCRLTLRGRMTAQYKLDHPKATVEEIASALGRAEIAWDEEFKAEHPW